MANTITYSSRVIELTIAASSGTIVTDDYIKQATSNAEGIVVYVADTTHLTVAEMVGTFNNSNNVTAEVSGAVATVSALVDPSGQIAAGYAPSYVSLVTGTNDASETNIFRMVADGATATYITEPDSSSQWLGMDMLIYIGRRGQAAVSKAISNNEMVDMQTGNTAGIRIIGKSGTLSTLTFGYAKYLDDDEVNFPPMYTHSGTKLKGNYSNTTFIYCDTYGEFNFYDSQLFADDYTVNSNYSTFEGYFRGANSLFKDCTYSIISGTWYMYDFTFEGIDSAFVPLTAPTYMEKVLIQNIQQVEVGTGFYAAFVGYEADIKDLKVYKNDGSLEPKWFGAAYASPTLHLLNTHIDYNALDSSTFASGGVYAVVNNALDLTVVDEEGNPISGATIEIKDKYGLSLFKQLSVTKSTAGMNATATTLYTSAATTDLDSTDNYVGDTPIVRLRIEKMRVTGKTSSTQYTVVRGVEGTTAMAQSTTTWRIYKATRPVTDSNGKIFTSGTSLYEIMSQILNINVGASFNPFIIRIRKPGYKEYKKKFIISGDLLKSGTTDGLAKTVTMSIASPCVVTLTGHSLKIGTPVSFTTTGALPTGITAGTTYYARPDLTLTEADEFWLYGTRAQAIAGGSTGRINTSGSQSGVHSISTCYLIDSTANFTLANCPVGSIVHNTTDNTFSTVNGIYSTTTVSLREDIMASGENYKIYKPLITGLSWKIALKKNRFRETKSLPQ